MMRVLVALDCGDTATAAEGLAEIAAEHEVVIACADGSALGLALRNALPEREVATVLSQVVVDSADPGSGALAEPQAIVELRSIRSLLDAGALVVCACAERAPVIIDRDGTMREVDAIVDGNLTAALLARRLEADLLLMLTDGAPGSEPAKAEAARRFVGATERRAAIGALTDAVQMVRGVAGTQLAPRHA